MAAEHVLVIDAGTSAMRALAVALEGGAVTPLARESYRTAVPEDAAPYGRELPGSDLRDSLERMLGAAATWGGGAFSALAFTGQREGLVFADAHGAALLASPNIDARAAAHGMAMDAARGADVYATTGHLPSLLQAPAKFAWLRAERPPLAERVRCVLPLADWLATSASGGSGVMSRSLAAEVGLLDVARGVVPEALLGALGLPVDLLPPVVADGSAAGTVASGPLRGTPVLVAGADTQCALLGMGALDAGDAAVPAGWSAPVQLVTEAPVLDPHRRTWTGVHVAPERWVLESNAGDTGRAWEWLCAVLGVTPAAADALAAQSAPGAGDVVCLTGARTMRAAEMTAGIGAITFPLPLVMSRPERPDLLRAMLESVAFAVRANLAQIEGIARTSVRGLSLGGGMSRGATFARILADVLDRPVAVAPSPETTAAGAAMLAAATLGRYGSLAAAVAVMRGAATALAPRPAAAAAYDDTYARWCALADAMATAAAEGG